MEARSKRKRHVIHRNPRGGTRHKVQTRIWRGRGKGGHFSFAGHPLYQRAREGTVRPGSVNTVQTESERRVGRALMLCADSPKGVNFQPRWTSISKRHQRVSFGCEEHTCAVWSVKSNAPRALYFLFNFSFLLGGTPSERLRNAPVAFRTRLNASL